jgi:hypothetical protein
MAFHWSNLLLKLLTNKADDNEKGHFRRTYSKHFSFVIDFADISFCFHVVWAWLADGFRQRKLHRQWFIKYFLQAFHQLPLRPVHKKRTLFVGR